MQCSITRSTAPLIEIAIEPKSKADQEKLGVALAKLAAEDPSFRVTTDQESGQTLLKGMSEQHLDLKIDILKRIYRIDADFGAPQVAYRESITRPVTVDFTYERQTGSYGQFARVKIVAQPLFPGTGVQFENDVAGGTIPKEYMPAIERGLESVLDAGVIAGFPVMDIKVSLVDGASHAVDSSALAFESAARAALREALQKGHPVLLEPIMKVEVVTPEDYTGSVIGDLNSRRGKIHGQDRRGNATIVHAIVPLANMFGFAEALRSLTKGHATFETQLDRYAPVPLLPPDDRPFPPAAAMPA
jgi:elongation factor G